MTDRQFLERMIFLTEKMCDIYNAEPLDQDARQAIRDEVHELGQKFNRSHRVSPRVMNFFYIAAILFVVYLVYCILSEGFF